MCDQIGKRQRCLSRGEELRMVMAGDNLEEAEEESEGEIDADGLDERL